MKHKYELQNCLIFLSIWTSSYTSNYLIDQGYKILGCILTAIEALIFFIILDAIRKK